MEVHPQQGFSRGSASTLKVMFLGEEYNGEEGHKCGSGVPAVGRGIKGKGE